MKIGQKHPPGGVAYTADTLGSVTKYTEMAANESLPYHTKKGPIPLWLAHGGVL